MNNNKTGVTIAGTIAVIALIVLLMWGLPTYKVWSKEQRGKATLAEARFSRQVKLEEAKTNLESQKLNAKAEVERAKGAAEAMRIEGDHLTENYIRYLWVQTQSQNDKTVIYVPTEAGLPITESQRVGR